LLGIVILAAIVFLSGAVFTYRDSGWSVTSIGFIAMSVASCAAVIEVATTRVVLSEQVLEAGSIWSRRRYAAAQITSVTWAAGSGVALKLANGGWAKLPELGYNSQGLTNTIRAWLKRTGTGGA
jgi:hypothetical protein